MTMDTEHMLAEFLCANGRMKGMAPQAQLIALKVLGKDGGGQTERVIRGLQWVLAHHKELGIRILNFSVGFLPGHSTVSRSRLWNF